MSIFLTKCRALNSAFLHLAFQKGLLTHLLPALDLLNSFPFAILFSFLSLVILIEIQVNFFLISSLLEVMRLADQESFHSQLFFFEFEGDPPLCHRHSALSPIDSSIQPVFQFISVIFDPFR